MAGIPKLSPFRPLIPLPPNSADGPANYSQSAPPNQQEKIHESPFASLLDSSPVLSFPNHRPLFPVSTPKDGSRTPQIIPPTLHPQPQDSPETPGFGEFVSADPLQDQSESSLLSFSPVTHTVPSLRPGDPNEVDNSEVNLKDDEDLLFFGASSQGTTFQGNSFIQEAKLRTKERGQKVMGELLDRPDDPLYFFRNDEVTPSESSGFHSVPTTTKSPDTFLQDGFEELFIEKEAELQDELDQHGVLPSTPRASRSGTPNPVAMYSGTSGVDDDDIIDLKTGKRESGRARPPKTERPPTRPVNISSSKRQSHRSNPSTTTASPRATSPPTSASTGQLTSYFTLTRKWLSSSLPQSAEPPPQHVSRQESLGQFTPLPHPDFSFGTLGRTSSDSALSECGQSSCPPTAGASTTKSKTSGRPPLAGVFESLDSGSTLSSPFSKKVFIPATGAPGFRPEENWNPDNFEYDPKSKIDALGAGVELIGRSMSTFNVLTSDVANEIRSHLPALARLPHKWSLLYSTDQHGISIATFYKNVEKAYGNANGVVLAVREAEEESEFGSFGVYVGGGIKWHEGSYYGSGESFLWKTVSKEGHPPRVKVFKWTGMNDYVALCESSFISFGGGDGEYGLYIDSSFLDGSSEKCATFNNDVLCGGDDDGRSPSRRRFECIAVEVWRVGGP